MKRPGVAEKKVVDPDLEPDFYKERRMNTKSPLGPDSTSVEETTKVITRGFRKPEGIIVPAKKRGFFGRIKRIFGSD